MRCITPALALGLVVFFGFLDVHSETPPPMPKPGGTAKTKKPSGMKLLVVTNDACEVRIDGVSVGRLEQGQARDFPIASTGDHLVEAVSSLDGHVWSGAVTIEKPGQVMLRVDPGEARRAREAQAAQLRQAEENAYQTALSQKTRDGYESFLSRFPNGSRAVEVRAKLATCRVGTRSVPTTGKSQVSSGRVQKSDFSESEACSLARNAAVEKLERQCSGELSNVDSEDYGARKRMFGFCIEGGPVACQYIYDCSASATASCESTRSKQESYEVCD